MYQSKTIACLYFVCFCFLSVIAQERCGNESLQEYLSHHPAYLRAFNESNLQITNSLATQRGGGDEILVIPIVVHVLHKGEPVGTGSNISDQQIFDAVRGANERWRKITGNGVDMNVEFCLASKDPDGNPSNGIDRIDARSVPDYEAYGISYLGGQGGDELRLKNLSNWPHTYVYNIWVVHEIAGDWAGFALFPYNFQYAADGSVVHASYMTYNSSTLAHEIGHGMALFHTFNGDNQGCPSDGNCSTQGDWVCDTPPHKQSDCSSSTCSDSDSLFKSFRNYMSYCGNKTLFTQGQKDRARTAITTLSRKKLLTSTACSGECAEVHISIDTATCDAEQAGSKIDTIFTSGSCDTIITTNTLLILKPEADFTFTTGIDGMVLITNSSQHSDTYEWDFGDDSSSTDTDPLHQFSAEGTYTVTLIAGNDCGTDTISYPVEIMLTGIQDRPSTPVLYGYPNPGNGNFTIDIPPVLRNADRIKIMNQVGQIVMFSPVYPMTGKIQLESQLPPGVYYVALYSKEERLAILRLLIQ